MMARSSFTSSSVTFPPRIGEAGLVGPARARDGVRVRSGSESCFYFCALRSRQKKCVFRSGLHTRAETAGPTETRPHGGSVQGFPNNFMSRTSKQARATTNRPSQLSQKQDGVGKFELFSSVANSICTCAHSQFTMIAVCRCHKAPD